MKKDIAIVGNGGLAHEINYLIERVNQQSAEWNFIGYIDIAEGDKVIGDDDYILNYDKELFVSIAIANPALRKKIAEQYRKNKNIHYPNLIDPSVVISDMVSLGEGNIICGNCFMTVNIDIGNFNIINYSCTIGHDFIIKDYVTILPGSNISGNVHMGNCITIGAGVQILQGLHIADKTVIGAGAVVISDMPGACTAVGVPARIIKKQEGYIL